MKKPTKFGKARVRGRRVLRSWIFRGLVVLALLGGMGYAGLWAFGKLERRQSRKLTAMSTEYLKEGQGQAARMGLETALRLDPKNAQALRMLARLRETQGAGLEAIDSMRRLSESGQMTLDDLSAYAVMAARQGDMPLAERLANAAAQGGNPVLRHLLRAEVGLTKNNPEEAEKELRAAAEEDKSGTVRISLARFLISQGLTAESAGEVFQRVLPSWEVKIMDNSLIFIEKQVYKNVTHFGGQIPKGFEVFLRGHPGHIDGQFECDQSQYRSTDFHSAS